MELLVRVRWRHVPPADLQIDVQPHHSVRDLISAASNYCDGKWDESQPVFLERNATALSLDVPIVESGIVSGDTLRFELYGIDFIDRESMSEAVSCDVTAGPEAGRSFVLLPGRHEVGRRVDFAVVLEDVTVSEHQLSVIVYDDLVTRLVPDPNAINPLVVNGSTSTDSVVVGANDVVQFGATAVSFRVFSRSSDSELDQLGQVPFRRTPARPVVVTKREFKAIGGAPVKPDKRKFPVMMVMAPAIMGLGMFAVMQQPTMLMMMAMSPMMAAFNYMESRKTGVEKYSTSVQRFGEKLEKRKAEVEQALLDERAERIHQSPDLADLARRATLRTLDLWPRQRNDDAFMRTRLGIGTVASKVTVEPENSGDDHIRDAVAMTLAGHDKLMACPIAINLKELGVFGLHGPEGDVRAMCSSVILQAVTLHSPEDLVLVLIEGTTQGLGAWAKWLPHTRSATSPLSGKHIVESEAAAADMMRELVSVARLRTADGNDRSDHRWPWILVVIDESANVDPAIASQLLELCPTAGISVIAAVESDARIPRQAKATLDCRPPHGGALSSVWFTDAETPSEQFEPEPANARLIDQVAMSLAPLRDATAASATTAIPRVVPLLSLFGPELPTPLSVAAEWSQDKPYGLRAPIGVGPAGPLELDLVEHGPHALIGGTSGAGKSELLQSIVASLIHQYPPTRLTFLFVDYKGGASSTVFNDVPHTVGYVTNLEASLSLRALTSLRAELNYRMRLMEGKAKDLPEMLERYPDEAPPSLVIVVDEFATLVKEVPDFVAGVVDIAQRGRSLGVHLILATQRPSGSVNDNILANTNLRISLRMLDGQESQTIIGVKSAADIPLPLKGRGFAKLGPRDLIEFQSAYTGAPLAEESDVTPVIVNRFGSIARLGASSTTGWRQTSGGSRVGSGSSGGRFTPVPELQTPPGVAPVVNYEPLVDATGALAPPMSAPMQPPKPPLSPPAARERVPTIIAFPDKKPTTSGEGSGGARVEHQQSQTHLDVLLNAVRNAMPNLPAARKPWREMLPEELPWSRIERPEQTRAAGRAGRYITIGMLDDPAAQAQYPAVFDLEEGGGLLVAGGGGSGKTTALRTAALAAVADASPDEVCLFVVDCASRSLVALRELPHCAAVATGDDLESITRVIATLARELDRRRALLSDLSVQAETLSAYLDKGFSMPRIVLLIDGFQNVASIVGQVQTMVYGPLDWLAELYRVITDGRQVGIHVVIATDRRQGVPALILSAIASRLVLRQTEENAYSDYGVPMAVYRGLELPSGRGLWNNQLVQVGLVSDGPAAAAQGAAISAAATAMAASTDRRPPTQLVAVPAPDEVRVPLQASTPTRATLGRSDVFDEVVEVDIEHAGLFVFGPPRSGRTTALRQVARSLVAAGYEVWSVGIGDIGGPGRHTTGRGDAVAELINEFAALCESLPKPTPYVLVIDNVDRYGDSAITSAYDRIVKAEASRTIAATESRFQGGYTQNSMLAEVRLEPTVLVLQPDNAADVLSSTGVRPQLRPGYKMRPGRGVFIANRQPTVVQVAVDSND